MSALAALPRLIATRANGGKSLGATKDNVANSGRASGEQQRPGAPGTRLCINRGLACSRRVHANPERCLSHAVACELSRRPPDGGAASFTRLAAQHSVHVEGRRSRIAAPVTGIEADARSGTARRDLPVP